MRGAPLLDRLISKIQHDFLWRTTRELPKRGRIGIFNRSYYEEVLIVRVHREILRSEGIPSAPHDDKAVGTTGIVRSWIWRNTSTATEPRIIKFFLHLSKEPAGSVSPQSTASTKRFRRGKVATVAAPPAPAQPNSVTGTPLRIPYGNKEVALKLGARYRSGGWYAPPGVDLSAFEERGWL